MRAAMVRLVLIEIASSHSCGRTRDFGVLCWGANDAGQLGDGTEERRLAPVRVELRP